MLRVRWRRSEKSISIAGQYSGKCQILHMFLSVAQGKVRTLCTLFWRETMAWKRRRHLCLRSSFLRSAEPAAGMVVESMGQEVRHDSEPMDDLLLCPKLPPEKNFLWEELPPVQEVSHCAEVLPFAHCAEDLPFARGAEDLPFAHCADGRVFDGHSLPFSLA